MRDDVDAVGGGCHAVIVATSSGLPADPDLAEVRLREPVSLQSLKLEWIEMLRAARDLVERLPSGEVGCLYLDAQGQPVTPQPEQPSFAELTRHVGQLKGSWPRVVE